MAVNEASYSISIQRDISVALDYLKIFIVVASTEVWAVSTKQPKLQANTKDI